MLSEIGGSVKTARPGGQALGSRFASVARDD
jgi:hypothetical protein